MLELNMEWPKVKRLTGRLAKLYYCYMLCFFRSKTLSRIRIFFFLKKQASHFQSPSINCGFSLNPEFPRRNLRLPSAPGKMFWNYHKLKAKAVIVYNWWTSFNLWKVCCDRFDEWEAWQMGQKVVFILTRNCDLGSLIQKSSPDAWNELRSSKAIKTLQYKVVKFVDGKHDIWNPFSCFFHNCATLSPDGKS